METDYLLHVASPKGAQHATNPKNPATAPATAMQQSSLKALAGAVLRRNSPRNSHATGGQKPCNNSHVFTPQFVASDLGVPSTGGADLDELIDLVGRHYDTPADEYPLIREIAAGDIEGALMSFRLMAGRHLLFSDEPTPDDRVMCRDCKNLTGPGQCLAARRGLMPDTYKGYQPVPDVLHHCEHFK